DGDVKDYLEVEVKDADLCPRYTAMVVKNIRLAPSPRWLQQRLASNGIRPINNVVDITNYVMEEYGQPMHAFDYDTIAGHKIVVKRANDGEKFVTLDGQERTLDSEILLICDAEKPIGLAGIMGGEDSKITDDVKTLVFESACFDGTNNRLAAKRLGLRTDASGKFEKGLDPNNTVPAILRACQLIEELDAGDVVGGMIDIYPEPVEPKKIPFDADAINAFLGTDIDKETQLSYFPPLEIEYDEKTGMLTVPTFRQDLLREADIAEEVARFFGYANIPSTLPTSVETQGGLTYSFIIANRTRETLKAYGYSESMTYSFESPKVFDKLRFPEDDVLRQAIKISNPLGEDYSIMRTSLFNGLLSSLSTNYNRRNKTASLFELGNVYIPKTLPLTELPEERMTLCFGFYGDGDFFDLKGALEQVLKDLGVKVPRKYEPDHGIPFLHPGRQALVTIKGGREKIACLGQLHPLVAKTYGIGTDTFVAQLNLEAILDMTGFEKKFKPIPKYPAVTRDLSMIMKKSVHADEIEEVISKCGGRLIESYQLFDIYEGDRIGSGLKSLAYSLTFRSADRTLEDKDVNPI
ncbi:MAG: phenylalanine--tRNA ligase subunit beta, partial [Parasporobacterium sp.]|nr:phenylalanine--tRNA ligase subunit beta [Parasporobacterium sp.]